MELKKVIKELKKNSKSLVVAALFGGLVGVLIYTLPPTYKTQGSFYISKSQQLSEDGSFSYEGYYSQQVAISLTNTTSALIESPDVGAQVLKNLGIDVTERTLRKYKSQVRVVKNSPQLVTLVAKAKSQSGATNLWYAIADSIENTLDMSTLEILRVAESPVETESYRSLPVFTLLGVVSGWMFGIILVATKEYFKS